MAKTLLHKELKEKKKAKNNETKERYGLSFSKRTKIIIGGICAVLVITPIAIHFGTKDKVETPVKTEPSKEAVTVDDKYVVDSNGEITFLNGDEVAKSIGNTYSTKIATTYDGGSSDFTIEVDMDDAFYIEHYHGTKNGVTFDEACISTLTQGLFLANKDGQFAEVDEVTYANIDGKYLLESVLCGDELVKKDNTFTSNVKLSVMSTVFPYEVVSAYYDRIMEENDGDLPSDILATSVPVTMTYKGDSVTLAATCEFGTVDIEIKNIEALSEDFSQFIQ